MNVDFSSRPHEHHVILQYFKTSSNFGYSKENCEDIGVDAKEINEKRAQAKEAKMIADAKAFLESCEEKDA